MVVSHAFGKNLLIPVFCRWRAVFLLGTGYFQSGWFNHSAEDLTKVIKVDRFGTHYSCHFPSSCLRLSFWSCLSSPWIAGILGGVGLTGWPCLGLFERRWPFSGTSWLFSKWTFTTCILKSAIAVEMHKSWGLFCWREYFLKYVSFWGWYCPVIPMVLVNGVEGIGPCLSEGTTVASLNCSHPLHRLKGTGWSSSVPNFNPRDAQQQRWG